MVTADTITDEQIRELGKDANVCDEIAGVCADRVYHLTRLALGAAIRDGRTNIEARTRCAEILNARSKAVR